MTRTVGDFTCTLMKISMGRLQRRNRNFPFFFWSLYE